MGEEAGRPETVSRAKMGEEEFDKNVLIISCDAAYTSVGPCHAISNIVAVIIDVPNTTTVCCSNPRRFTIVSYYV